MVCCKSSSASNSDCCRPQQNVAGHNSCGDGDEQLLRGLWTAEDRPSVDGPRLEGLLRQRASLTVVDCLDRAEVLAEVLPRSHFLTRRIGRESGMRHMMSLLFQRQPPHHSPSTWKQPRSKLREVTVNVSGSASSTDQHYRSVQNATVTLSPKYITTAPQITRRRVRQT